MHEFDIFDGIEDIRNMSNKEKRFICATCACLRKKFKL